MWKNLEKFLSGVTFNEPVEIDEADASSIFQGMDKALKENKGPSQSIGLHYTGGTKAMSTHAYRAVERWCNKNAPNAQLVFSYLDARSLEVVFDPLNPKSDSSERVYLGDKVKIALEQLIGLHGWSFKKRFEKPMLPAQKALLPSTAKALAQLYSTNEGMNAWRDWKSKSSGLSKCKTDGEWDKSKIKNATLVLSNDPLFDAVNNSLKKELSLSSLQISLASIPVSPLGGKGLCEWLDGKWLEHHVLQCLVDLQKPPDSLGLHGCCTSIETEEIHFEVDVVGLRGYQLFAFSCGTGSKEQFKLKLFEAFVRARQLGGDEARVALVCPADRDFVDKLLYEMSRDIEPDSRIQVFGQDEFADLKTSIGNWIQEQSR